MTRTSTQHCKIYIPFYFCSNLSFLQQVRMPVSQPISHPTSCTLWTSRRRLVPPSVSMPYLLPWLTHISLQAQHSQESWTPLLYSIRTLCRLWSHNLVCDTSPAVSPLAKTPPHWHHSFCSAKHCSYSAP